MLITSRIVGEALTRREDAQLRLDFAALALRCFRELNPLMAFAMNWHVEVIATQLAAVRAGEIRRLIVQYAAALPEIAVGLGGVSGVVPRASAGTQILCVSLLGTSPTS